MTVVKGHVGVLDGWRGISILLVLAAHLLPLGPKSFALNAAAGAAGMALFFALSGFLITNALLKDQSVTIFLLRRFARVVPLAWLCLVIALIWVDAPLAQWLANMFFYANWPPMQLTAVLGPIWSLCVEVQFYVAAAILILIFRKQGLLVLPVLCIAITMLRVFDGVHIAINTYYRLDEILAGCTLALLLAHRSGSGAVVRISWLNLWVLIVLFFISCHSAGGFLNYFRPYLAALLIGVSLLSGDTYVNRALYSKVLVYVAAISYALYMIHPLLDHSWLGSGEVVEKYVKRPLLFVVLFVLAHVSTFYFEYRCIAWAKTLSKRLMTQDKVESTS